MLLIPNCVEISTGDAPIEAELQQAIAIDVEINQFLNQHSNMAENPQPGKKARIVPQKSMAIQTMLLMFRS